MKIQLQKRDAIMKKHGRLNLSLLVTDYAWRKRIRSEER